MTSLVKTLVALIGVLWLGVAGAAGMGWWDRRPPHTPSVHVLFFTWAAPDSLGAKLAALTARLKQSEANLATLTAAIGEQNGRIEALSKAGATATARAEAVLKAQQPAQVRAVAAQAALAKPLTGATVCDRAKSVDDAFVETLK